MSGNRITKDDANPEPASTRLVPTNELRRLREELEWHKQFLETIPPMVYEADAQGKMTYFNQATSTGMGVTPEDIAAGIHMFDLIHPDDVDMAKHNIERVAKGGNSHGNEYRLRRRDGTTFEALVYSTPIVEDGVVQGIRGIAIDISAKKAAEAKMRLLRELSGALAISSTMDQVADALYDLSRELPGVDCGGLYRLDYKTGGLTLVKAWGLSDVFIDHVRNYCADTVQVQVLNRGQTLNVRHSDLSPNNDPIREAEGLKALSVVPIIHEGKLVAALNLASHNLDEMPSRTLEILGEIPAYLSGAVSRIQAETEMREQDARYKAIVDNSREVVFIMNPSSLDFMSSRIEELTGFTRAELKGMDPTTLLHKEDRERFALMWESRGRTIPLPAMFDFRVITKAGQMKHCQASLVPISYHGSDSILGTVRDVSDEKRAQAEMLNVSKLEALSILAGGIAHDFNNFLAAILGNISLAREDANMLGMDGAFVSLSEAEKACGRATELNRRLLTFAKGGAPIKAAASLPEVVMETARFTLSGSDIAVIENFPETLWPVNIDSGQISQVIQNLIVNAMHAMAQGRAKRLEISADNIELDKPNQFYLEPGRYVRLSVTDYGCGIPEENLSRIFDPFYTTKPTGNGLGLATSYSILLQHKGRIEAESKVGVGTTFRLFLPAAESNAVSGRTSARPISGHGRILVVDDESMVRAVCHRLGQRLGYTMEEAKDGIDAVQMYNDAKKSGVPYDLVILDLTIPGGMGGLKTLPMLKAIDDNCFFVVSSGYSDGGTMAEHEKAGFDEVLAKPYNLEKLSRVLARRKKKAGS